MDYYHHYQKLMDRGKSRILPTSVYIERHHIIPKCLGGSNDPSNIVSLTPSEHYIAHQLLVKIYPTNLGLLYAATTMTSKTKGPRSTNKIYGWLRERRAKLQSIEFTGKTASPETRLKLRIAKLGKPHTDEHKKNLRKAWETRERNFRHTSESREKIRLSWIQRKQKKTNLMECSQ